MVSRYTQIYVVIEMEDPDGNLITVMSSFARG